MAISANEHVTEGSPRTASLKLRDLEGVARLTGGGMQVIADQAHIFYAAKQIEQFQKDPKASKPDAPG